ncbi:MAG: pyrimidine reductase family protein [Corynebacteriales bacterium]|nr:pyrimidine reductase family protein [Mycobacteriales bacterium]
MESSAGELTDDQLANLYQVPTATHTFVRANFVSSLDGSIAIDGHSAGLSNAADMRVFRLLRDACDAVLVGAGTFRVEDYRPLRLNPQRREKRIGVGKTEYPTLVVVSRSGALDPTAQAFTQAPVRPIVITNADADQLKGVADVIATEDLRDALTQLADRGLNHILCEGGPHLLRSLIDVDAVDELCLTLSAQLVGASATLTGPASLPPRHAKLRHVLRDADTLLLRYALDR